MPMSAPSPQLQLRTICTISRRAGKEAAEEEGRENGSRRERENGKPIST
jgi:hypothetical protein